MDQTVPESTPPVTSAHRNNFHLLRLLAALQVLLFHGLRHLFAAVLATKTVIQVPAPRLKTAGPAFRA